MEQLHQQTGVTWAPSKSNPQERSLLLRNNHHLNCQQLAQANLTLATHRKLSTRYSEMLHNYKNLDPYFRVESKDKKRFYYIWGIKKNCL